MSRRIHLVLSILLTLALLTSCQTSPHDFYRSHRRGLDDAARYVTGLVLRQADATWVTLPDRYRGVARDSEAAYFVRSNREFVFIPRELNGGMEQGLVYSADGKPPSSQLFQSLQQLGPNWWVGSIPESSLPAKG